MTKLIIIIKKGLVNQKELNIDIVAFFILVPNINE